MRQPVQGRVADHWYMALQQWRQAGGYRLQESRRQADIVRGQGQEEITVQERLVRAVGLEDVLHEIIRLVATLLHHPQLSGAEQDGLPPAR